MCDLDRRHNGVYNNTHCILITLLIHCRRYKKVRINAARAWSIWEASTSKLIQTKKALHSFDDDDVAEAFARIECHYFINKGFFENEDWILNNVNKISNKLFFNPVLGFSFTTLLILFLFSFNILLIGVVGEYVTRIYDEVKTRPNYIVEDIIKKKN